MIMFLLLSSPVWVILCLRSCLLGQIEIGACFRHPRHRPLLPCGILTPLKTFDRLKRRKNKMFRFTPSPVSSAGIFWWCGKGGFADRQCTMDVNMPTWWDEHFPPLSIYYGGRDYLVLTEPLLERIEKQEKTVKVVRVKKLEEAEHCDFYWAADAVEWCFNDIVGELLPFVSFGQGRVGYLTKLKLFSTEDIEKTRPQPGQDRIRSPIQATAIIEEPEEAQLIDV